MQAPLQVYARMLAQKAQQQRALQRADAVEADREDDASSEDEEAGAGSMAAGRPSADAGEALAASAQPLARKKASKAPPVKIPIPQVTFQAQVCNADCNASNAHRLFRSC